MNATAAAETDLNLNFELIEIDVLKPSQTNARKVFNKEKLAELAASIKQHGVMQPILVRVHPEEKDCFEIIAGERRYRACKKAKLDMIPCRIMESDDVDSVEKQSAENLFREDLNPIEEAHTWANLLEVTGLTQQKLATRYKVKQPYIAGRLRLLKLPDEWQQKLVDGEFPPTFARHLIPWVKYPQVFAELPACIEEMRERYRDNGQESVELGMPDLLEALGDALHCASIAMYQAKFSVTDDLKKQLQVEPIETAWGSPSERAFNTDLYHELQKKAEADQKKFMESGGSGLKKKAASKSGTLFDVDEDGEIVEAEDTRTPEEVQADIDLADKEAAKKRKELLARKYADWKCAWYREAIGQQLDRRDATDGFMFKLLLFFTVTNEHGINSFRLNGLQAGVKTWGGKLQSSHYGYRANVWPGIGSVGSSGKDLAATTLASYVRIPSEHSALSHYDIGEIAKELGIDIEKEWKLTEDFLQMHTKPQLLELASEWKYPMVGLEELKRDDLILALLEAESQLRLEFDKKKDKKNQPASCPKALAKLKFSK